MASSLIAVAAALLSLLLAIALVDATVKHSYHHAVGRRHSNHPYHRRAAHPYHHRAGHPYHRRAAHPYHARAVHRPLVKHHRPKFKPGPWVHAHATFYEGSSTSFGGACNYKDVIASGFGLNTVAVSDVLFKNGQACGACYELQCVDDPHYCKLGQPSLTITATDRCPPNPSQPSDNGGWCNPPREHFDIAKPVFNQLADYVAGIIPVQYRRVPCQRRGGIRFTITGNPWFYQVVVWNVGGAGDVTSLQVKGNKKLKWTQMQRDWGTTWKTSAILQGESLTFRVQASDGRFSTAWHVAPKNWQFGQTFEGKNFK